MKKEVIHFSSIPKFSGLLGKLISEVQPLLILIGREGKQTLISMVMLQQLKYMTSVSAAMKTWIQKHYIDWFWTESAKKAGGHRP